MNATQDTAQAATLSSHVSDQNGAGVPADQDRQNGAQATVAVPRKGTRKSATKDKDNAEYGKFTRRMIRAYGRRVEAEDPSTLSELLAIRAELDAVERRAARSLHDQGWSWAEIAQECGITKGAAYKRWGQDA